MDSYTDTRVACAAPSKKKKKTRTDAVEESDLKKKTRKEKICFAKKILICTNFEASVFFPLFSFLASPALVGRNICLRGQRSNPPSCEDGDASVCFHCDWIKPHKRHR